MAESRIVCLFVPQFPLAARLRGEPELAHELVVVVEGQGTRARVIACTERARRAGVEPGMALAQARGLASGLIARGRDEAGERGACQALGDAAESLTPRVEDAAEGVVFLDTDGLERRHPTESALAEAARTAARSVGLVPRVGIAASKRVALVAARIADDIRIVPPGEEAEFLAPLDVALLDPDGDTARALDGWGVRTIGDLARLAPAEVASRLGRAGRDLATAARGVDARVLVPRSRPPVFLEGMELDWPLVSLEPFQFIARAALDRLAERLAARGLAATRLTLRLTLDPCAHDVRTIELPAPTREAKTLLELTRLSLEQRAPGAPVVGFAFEAEPALPRRAQGTLFGPPEPSPEKLATTVARLAARLGEEHVGSPRVLDGHRPERFARVPYAPPPASSASREVQTRRGHGLLAVRVLRPPVPLEVIVEEGRGGACPRPPDGAPIEQGVFELELHRLRLVSVQSEQMSARRGTEPPALRAKPDRRAIHGAVRVASGPWTIEEKWWGERPISRDYWDIELSGGGLYRLYRERATGCWFADGVYD